ncbi:hypothetical protein ACFUIZ_19005 [Streptomyces cinereoruber]|uniref:hypothetical protein n=1 Tax=Streptomyces cinereoruber TaxID=67260 RepID=UPI00362C7F1A
MTDPTPYHWILTLSAPYGSGKITATNTGTINALPGQTRESAYEAIYAYCVEREPRLGNANVVFFALERNAL